MRGSVNGKGAMQVATCSKNDMRNLKFIYVCTEIAKKASPTLVGKLVSLIPGGILPPIIAVVIAVGGKLTADVVIDEIGKFLMDISDGRYDKSFKGIKIEKLKEEFEKQKPSLLKEIGNALSEFYKKENKDKNILQS